MYSGKASLVWITLGCLIARSRCPPEAHFLTDGMAWMAFSCLNMLNMARELAEHNPVYEDKFFEHFIFIADAMTYPDFEDKHSLE
ncbi:hypothetical protein EDB85DRAFT_1608886 [Lactarius pseudohatsudake]|nr:hypothetical protein EDB85DRAFT_1608886 [Lactarius pseudohatsudake]